MELTIAPEWCKDFCPELAVYNKVFVRRSGKGLFSHIVFTGPDECVASVIEKEEEFFNESNIHVVVDGEPMDNTEGTVIIHRYDCSHTRANTFDVSGYKGFMVDDLFKRFELDLSHIDKDKLFKEYKLKDLDKDELVNNVLLNHYAHFDDDVLREADFEWIKDKAKVEAVVNSEDEAKMQPSMTEDAAVVDITAAKEPEDTTVIKKPKNSTIVKESEEPENSTTAKESEKNNPTVTEPEQEITESGEEEENTVPKPTVPITKKNDGYKIKDSLTEDEEVRNAELLSDLVVEYKNTIDYITELKNARWNIMLNKMKDCVKNSTFNQQWCVLYLNMSDDTANELYSRLYELDEKTKKFHQEIVHQVEHLSCPICGKDSEEDVTFLSKGVHFIECPYCYAKRPIEKK